MGRISMPQGKGSQLHNRRDYEKIGKAIPDNIQSYRTYQNVTIVDKDIRAAYKEIFGEVLQEYNKRQKRADRRIDDYYEHISKSKNGEKLFYEDVLQWGSMEDFRADPRLREKAKECLVEYAKTFEIRNPNLKLIGAYIHMDEASPHLHLDYIPIAKGYKTGLQIRNSLDKAMKQMGHTPVKESRKNNATKLWKEHERAYFTEICKSKGLKVEAERKARGSLSVDEYKEAKSNMLDGLNENKIALIREIADKNQTAYELLSKITQQQQELNYVKKQLEDVKTKLDISSKTLYISNNDIKTKNTTLNNLKVQIAANNKQLEVFEEQLINKRKELINLSISVNDKADELSSLNAYIASVRNEKQQLDTGIHDLEARKRNLDQKIAELESEKRNLDTEKRSIQQKVDDNIAWYKRNKPAIEQWQKLHLQIESNITAILRNFWIQYNTALNNKDSDKAVDTLKQVKDESMNYVDKYIPEIAKKQVKQNIEEKTDEGIEYVRRRRGR